MCNESRSKTVCARAAGLMLAVAAALVVSLPGTAFAQVQPVCGPEIKDEVAKALAAVEGASAAQQAAVQAQLYEKYQYCVQDVQAFATPAFYNAARQCGASVSNLGNLYFEEISCCGYDPQRRQFACPLKIKQRTGFGAAPLPGSREYVLHCVADANGVLQPVGQDSVHLSNEQYGAPPSWQFAVIANANTNLQLVQPMNGATRQARSILSWGISPNNNCAFNPIWGNALNYRIRLDQ